MSEPDKVPPDARPGIAKKRLASRLMTFIAVILAIALVGLGAYKSLAKVFGWGAMQVEPEPPKIAQPEMEKLKIVPIDTTIADVAEAAFPSIVSIVTVLPGYQETQPFTVVQPFPPRDRLGLGSGVIVRSDGYIVTNHHVIAQATDIRVKLHTGQELPAEVIGSDPSVDLALLRVDRRGLSAINFGDSDAARVGEVVLALGNSLDVGLTVSLGIISAKDRRIGLSAYESFLQTDATIDPGNSGGALIDLSGRLVGINAHIIGLDDEDGGLNFAVPGNLVDQTVKALISGQAPSGSWIGLSLQNLSPQLGKYFGLDNTNGVLIIDVAPGSIGEKAGFKANDIVLTLDGGQISDVAQLMSIAGLKDPSAPHTITIWRERRSIEITVTPEAAAD